MSFSITFKISFDNRSSNGSLQLSNASFGGGSSLISGDLPSTINPNNETFSLVGSMMAGVWGDATDASITIPFTVTNTKDSSKSASGNFKFYFSGGSDYPDYIVTEIDCGDKSQIERMSMDATEEELNTAPMFNAGTFDFLLADSGLSVGINSTTVSLSDIASVVEDVLEVAE